MTSRSIGRPKKRWEDDINDFLKQIYDETKKEETRENKISWISAANDRKEWSRLEEKYTCKKQNDKESKKEWSLRKAAAAATE